jgi:hypothetical protein
LGISAVIAITSTIGYLFYKRSIQRDETNEMLRLQEKLDKEGLSPLEKNLYMNFDPIGLNRTSFQLRIWIRQNKQFDLIPPNSKLHLSLKQLGKKGAEIFRFEPIVLTQEFLNNQIPVERCILFQNLKLSIPQKVRYLKLSAKIFHPTEKDSERLLTYWNAILKIGNSGFQIESPEKGWISRITK